MASTENMEKWKFWFVNVLIWCHVFLENLLLNALCAYLFNFTACKLLCLLQYKTDMRNMWLEHLKRKLRKIKKLFKMKELNKTVLEEGLIASIKGWLWLTKGHLGNQEWLMEVEYPLHQKFILTLLIQIKEKFSGRALFNEASDPQTPYFS